MTEQAGPPSIAVVGVGGVGGYLGGQLAAAGCDVQLLARGENLAALQRTGLCITNSSGNQTVSDVRASDDPHDIGEVDFVLLCVKTPQLPAAINALEPLVGGDTAVVTVQNGVETPERVAVEVGRGQVLPGTIRVVATMDGPGHVSHVGGPAALSFAEWDNTVSDRVTRLRQMLHGASLIAPEFSDIWVDLWAKFLVVTPVGSLGAATGGATIGELRSRPGTRRMLLAGMQEIHETAVALGIALPDDIVDTATGLMDRQAPDVTSSLQRDILAGRPSELEAWTGAVVRLADRGGRTAPVHEMLYELLATRTSLAAKTG